MADHEHGTMDIEVQEKTFAGFVTFVTRTVIIIIAALILLALING
ncbi:MAG: aa3-type cytochrome c oxidase subunit IV [Rhodobacteraceae bacterium]|nr:aa3-type cytochrome c oxidase subunit IV [Paracoccaceae bacterium]